MKKRQICDKLYVYSDLFLNIQETVKHFESNSEWVPWADTGSMINIHHSDYFFESSSFPGRESWDGWVESVNNKSVEKELYDIFYRVTSDYNQMFDPAMPEWYLDSATVCKYENNSGHSKEWSMTYHADFQIDDPSLYYFITVNMYLTDDYEGGEIHFKIPNLEQNKYDKIVIKPQAGDIVIFPSRYEHAVRPTALGSKIFVRMFWKTRGDRTRIMKLKEIYEVI